MTENILSQLEGGLNAQDIVAGILNGGSLTGGILNGGSLTGGKCPKGEHKSYRNEDGTMRSSPHCVKHHRRSRTGKLLNRSYFKKSATKKASKKKSALKSKSKSPSKKSLQKFR